MTKITFLGTGGDYYLVSKGIRNASGIVVQTDELQFFIDPGPNALLMAKNTNINPRATTAIICTSNKLIRCNDANALISAMTYEGMDVKGVLVGTKTLIEGNEEELPMIHNRSKKFVERIIEAEPDKKIGIEEVDIQFIEANDSYDTVGMKMLLPDVVVGYASDTSYNERIALQYKKVDILILNVHNPSGVKEQYQMSTDDAIKFIKKSKPQLAILTGFSKNMLEQDPLLEARKVHSETGCQVMAAIDGQTISPASYSAKSKQRRLK